MRKERWALAALLTVLFACESSPSAVDTSASPSGNILYAPAHEGFQEYARYTLNGSPTEDGSCLVTKTDTLALGETRQHRLVGLDPDTCEVIMALGSAIGWRA
jgi:hypothetical protein